MARSRRARHISLSMRPFKGIRVAVPPGLPLSFGETFAWSKTDWMRERLPRLKAAEQQLLARKAAMPGLSMDVPAAKALLKERLAELSKRHGLPCNRVVVKRQKTRWGSCSAKKNINLNLRLAALPQALMDYAILHELVHTRFLNHGPAFWEELERQLPGARKLHRELRRYDPSPARQPVF